MNQIKLGHMSIILYANYFIFKQLQIKLYLKVKIMYSDKSFYSVHQ